MVVGVGPPIEGKEGTTKGKMEMERKKQSWRRIKMDRQRELVKRKKRKKLQLDTMGNRQI